MGALLINSLNYISKKTWLSKIFRNMVKINIFIEISLK